MTDEVLKVACAEYRKWQHQLKDTPAYLNMKEWEKIILEQGGTVPSSDKEHKAIKAPLKIVVRPKPTTTAPESKISKVRRLAAECIQHNGGHATRDIIHEYLTSRGVDITVKNVSVSLSESNNFTSDRNLGWSVINTAAA